ncbi:MAG: taurine dioxygenase, partial [Betaproteobacteria bacterium]
MSELASPAVIDAGARLRSIRVEPMTCAIGAELSNVHLGVASRDADLTAEIHALLPAHKVP